MIFMIKYGCFILALLSVVFQVQGQTNEANKTKITKKVDWLPMPDIAIYRDGGTKVNVKAKTAIYELWRGNRVINEFKMEAFYDQATRDWRGLAPPKTYTSNLARRSTASLF